MRNISGWLLFALASWMMVSPQSLTGLKALQWMHQYSFAAEILVAIPVICAALYLLQLKPRSGVDKVSH